MPYRSLGWEWKDAALFSSFSEAGIERWTGDGPAWKCSLQGTIE